MKRILAIFLLITGVFLLNPYQEDQTDPEEALNQSHLPIQEVRSTQPQQEPAEEEDSLLLDQDFFLRELTQKKLPPLTKRERVIWSFRLAESHPFL